MIRHITEVGNVRNGRVHDPARTRHGVITAGRISDLSGWIDPATHLNLDFPGSLMNLVVVSETLEIGGAILTDNGKFAFASIDSSSYQHLGVVDLVKRSRQIHEIVRDLSIQG